MKQPRARGRFGNRQDGADAGGVVPFELGEHERDAVLVRELVQRERDALGEPMLLGFLIRWRNVTGWLGCIARGELAPARGRAQVMTGAIGRDAEQESAQRAPGLELADQVGQADEHLVHQIFGGLALTDQAMTKRAKRRLMFVVDAAEGCDVAPLDVAHQLCHRWSAGRESQIGPQESRQKGAFAMVFPLLVPAFMPPSIFLGP